MQGEHAPACGRSRPRPGNGGSRPLPPAVALLCLFTSTSAAALGLGGVEVASSLNQPLDARIPLHDVGPRGAEALEVGLASGARLREAGLEGARHLERLRFSVEPAAAGGHYVRVTSEGPIAEPFLRFLLRVDTGAGRVIRDYTLLLDPPTPATGDAPSAGSSAPVASPESPESPATDATPTQARTWGPVATGSSAWEVAAAVKADDASIYQTMVALLRANPDAFRDGDLGALKAGARLTVPPPAEVQSIPQEEAVAVYREQLGAVAAAPVAADTGGPDTAADPVAARRLPALSPIRSAAASQEGAEAVLRDAGGGEAGPRLPVRLDDRLGDLVGAVDTVEARVAAEGDRLGRVLSSQSGQLERVEQLLSGVRRDVAALREARPPPASAVRADADGLSYRSGALLALAGLLLGGLGGYAAGRGGHGFRSGRRVTTAAQAPSAVAATTDARDDEPTAAGQQRAHESPAERVTPSQPEEPAETGGDLPGDGPDMDIAELDWEGAGAGPPPNGDDHLFWADIYITERLPREAEKIVRDAIALYGERPGYRLKLLEALYSAGAREQYLREATRYRAAAIDEGTWDEVARMGRALAPDHPPFAGDAGGAAGTATRAGNAGTGTRVDPGAGEEPGIPASGAGVELVPDLSELDEAIAGDDGNAGAGVRPGDGQGSELLGDEVGPELEFDPLEVDPERSGDRHGGQGQAGPSAHGNDDAAGGGGDGDAGDADDYREAAGRG